MCSSLTAASDLVILQLNGSRVRRFATISPNDLLFLTPRRLVPDPAYVPVHTFEVKSHDARPDFDEDGNSDQ